MFRTYSLCMASRALYYLLAEEWTGCCRASAECHGALSFMLEFRVIAQWMCVPRA